jgi:biotin operon repressor
MVTAAVPMTPDDRPNTFGWLQIEKKTAGELQKLAIKSPVAMGTLMFMVNRMSRSNALVVSQAAIAEELGVTRRSINTAIGVLENGNFIETVKVGGAVVYRVNTRVAWQGVRGARFAHFNADIVAFENEQGKKLDDLPPLKSVPVLQENERVLIGNEPIDPPDQGELELP